MTETRTPPVDDDLEESTTPPRTTREFVSWQVGRLQREYLPPVQSSWARASLAELRRSLTQPLGSSPAVLEFVVNPSAPTTDGPETPDERSIVTALGLYAVHQQSQSVPMHLRSVGFGDAVGRIRLRDGDEVRGVTRRFQALGTAQTWDELVHHARGLVQLLRDRQQGFDYGRFAEDLVQFQHPASADRVRLRWGRAFYRVTTAPTTSTSTTTAEEQ
ncbi:type I-E CRISPR-associated protein Cse2/CasB [Cellulomonas fimi]|uniref:CRISPR-associated protein, Cse2 family n=1 Tax=Cellulomonas fimi (strain ATCC 484 / DSM 20113 / JCM 1341 / CCUG 24087 / LMG 16345 / NBRC 15513 / NCIMB 8980 / NCTC 7547 / NRS-133) TaxID=590998 RepID=F4H8A0_CELFA|nr:type I-E CRISPR-associated protein Cse2/CasB [Cellulomonas fimi]AEE44657.1 CRISPR-associated protein, Cse2 family [Cellulomonas fimi ATCC 484]NNH07470.1 type I-E CRISPR-associated protein Cse2/CasB [Cellulomonas fimi]VEH26913.1 CRISPR-associated Cse2 family protein [Cellulomonas fimi]